MTTVAMFKVDKEEQRVLTGGRRSSRHQQHKQDDCIEHGLSPATAALAETTANITPNNTTTMNMNYHCDNNNNAPLVMIEGGMPLSAPMSDASPSWPIMHPNQNRRRRRSRNNTLCIIVVAVIAVAILIASVGYAVGTTISKRNNAAAVSQLNNGGLSESTTTSSNNSGGGDDGVSDSTSSSSSSSVQLERPNDRAPEESDSTSTTSSKESLFDESTTTTDASTKPTSSPTKFSIDVSSWVDAFSTLDIDDAMLVDDSTATSTTDAPFATSSTSPSESPSFTPSSSFLNVFDNVEIPETEIIEETTIVVDTTTPSPSQAPSISPTTTPPAAAAAAPSCFTNSTYDAIDADIELLKDEIGDDTTRSHFLGGIVRLAAHDFMDYDLRNSTHPMGTDGCFDPDHQGNAGLPESVWCDTCSFKLLYESKYTHVSRADFWIASANAVIRQTSVDNALDLRDTFLWGRVDADTCVGSGDRLPIPGGCDESEGVFLTRMGLGWRDVVALMGAHTLGRGEDEVSWKDSMCDIYLHLHEICRCVYSPPNPLFFHLRCCSVLRT